jgi:Fe2+ or Zn2+ uptake regulation protein
MMHSSLVFRLRDHGVQPTAQRVAVAEYALQTDEHPSAEQVYAGCASAFRWSRERPSTTP